MGISNRWEPATSCYRCQPDNAVRIGRLAVDEKFQGRGLDAALLADAIQRTLRADPASFTLLVDAKNDQAVAFYQHSDWRRQTRLKPRRSRDVDLHRASTSGKSPYRVNFGNMMAGGWREVNNVPPK